MGQPRTHKCEGAPEGNVPHGHRKGNAHASTDGPRPGPSPARFSLNQVQSNKPDAIYTLTQKERGILKFPFQITEDGEIWLTEELDREDKDTVSGGLKQSTFTQLHGGGMFLIRVSALFH